MNGLRTELRRAVLQLFKRVELARFKSELREHISSYLFEQTGRSPIVIPVVNLVGGKIESRTVRANKQPLTETKTQSDQKRFQEMRSRLLVQSQRD